MGQGTDSESFDQSPLENVGTLDADVLGVGRVDVTLERGDVVKVVEPPPDSLYGESASSFASVGEPVDGVSGRGLSWLSTGLTS
ncbi:hypothetical protein GS575_23535 [Rhodococcus hoagii]|nr:hypothetical protein [Prescottella equi]